MSDTRQEFTASQIARAVGISRQAVSDALCSVVPAAKLHVNRTSAGAWSWEQLSVDWQMEITRRAIKRGFADGKAYLASVPLTTWTAPIPWGQVPGAEQAKAEKLRKALARALDLRGQGTKGAELEQVGMDDYRQAFGYPLKNPRHWRRLLHRTLERDGCDEDWNRIEIYLDDRAFAVPTRKLAAVLTYDFRAELRQILDALQDRLHPLQTIGNSFGGKSAHYLKSGRPQQPMRHKGAQ